MIEKSIHTAKYTQKPDQSQYLPAIAVWQPWADLIVPPPELIEAAGDMALILPKNIENRHRGRTLIHAARMIDTAVLDRYPWLRTLRFATGAIVGAVDIVDVVKKSDSPWHMHGMTGIVLANPIRAKTPIPYRGQQGMFKVPFSIVEDQL